MRVIERLFRLNIAAKIWLSIGIFILGFVFSVALTQVQGINTEHQLRMTAEGLFPAAMRSKEASTAFRRAVKGFEAAVVVHDRATLENALAEGRRSVDKLRGMAEDRGLPREHAAEARRVSVSVEQFLSAALATYGGPIGSATGLTLKRQIELRDLAARSTVIQASLQRMEDQFVDDLQAQLTALQARSANLRWIGLFVFAITLAVSAILVNITIRRVITVPMMLAEAELAHERDLLRILLDNIPDCIYFKDTDSRFTRINKGQCRLLGIEDENLAIGRTDLDYFDSEHAQQALTDEQKIVQTGCPQISKMERISGTGAKRRWMTSTKVPIKDDAGHVLGIVGVSRDITEYQAAVDALAESEKFLRLLFAAIPHAVWVYDTATFEFLESNQEATLRYGYSPAEFKEMKLSSLYPPDEFERLRQGLASLDPTTQPRGAWKHQTKDGRTLDVEVTARVLEVRGRRAILAVAEDVTERKRLELELQQSQRLESVGQLAAGIAHEINTPIQYVGDNLRFICDAFESRQKLFAEYEKLRQAVEAGTVSPALRQEMKDAMEAADLEYLAEEIPKALAQSLDGVSRVAGIVRAMKEFAHPGHTEAAAADLNRALENALIVTKNETKYVADVETDFGELPPVVCRIGEMNQVFLNLLVNAAHAIGEVTKDTQNRGKITVRTRRAGDMAVITISDTGCGIPVENQAKVFDQFFTTKGVGRGTGQGLSISRSIVVDKHGGSLTFEPNGTQGTVFTVSIPIEFGLVPAEDKAVSGRGAEQGEANEAHLVC